MSSVLKEVKPLTVSYNPFIHLLRDPHAAELLNQMYGEFIAEAGTTQKLHGVVPGRDLPGKWLKCHTYPAI